MRQKSYHSLLFLNLPESQLESPQENLCKQCSFPKHLHACLHAIICSSSSQRIDRCHREAIPSPRCMYMATRSPPTKRIQALHRHISNARRGRLQTNRRRKLRQSLRRRPLRAKRFPAISPLRREKNRITSRMVESEKSHRMRGSGYEERVEFACECRREE